MDDIDREALAACQRPAGPTRLTDSRNLANLRSNRLMGPLMSLPLATVFRALANERRLQVLHWLKTPTDHFPPQTDGDLIKDGVCNLRIAEKLGISQPTLSEHMRVLTHADLVVPKKIKQWTFYKRNEARIKELQKAIGNQV